MRISNPWFVWGLVALLSVNVASVRAWGSYVCDIEEKGLQKIGEICNGSAFLKTPLDAMEEKLEQIMDFIIDIKSAEDSWLQMSKKSGTVERDLSQHDEGSRGGKDSRTRGEPSGEDDDDYKRDSRGPSRTRGEGQDRDSRGGRFDWNDSSSRRDRTRDDDRDTAGRRQRSDDTYRTTGGDDDRHDETKRSTEVAVVSEKPKKKEEGPRKGECNAIVMDSHETIGLFYMMSYQHGHCANRHPIIEPIRYCLGYCATKTFIEREAGIWSQGNDCKSCQPSTYETLRIPLSCDDGFSFEKKFKNVVECGCRLCQPVDKKSRP